MAAGDVVLHGAVYGERVEGTPPRSLGFGVLAPAGQAAWKGGLETFARHLQAATYPDAWPPAELFCSVLLDESHRLVALVKYGVTDQTPSRRRGGIELAGVVGPASLTVEEARAIGRWLLGRPTHDTPDAPGGRWTMAEVMLAAPPARPAQPPDGEPLSLSAGERDRVYGARRPLEPDQRLELLDKRPDPCWQWLPLVGPEFPVSDYARRGPLVAWQASPGGQVFRPSNPEPAAALTADQQQRFFKYAAIVFVAVLLGVAIPATVFQVAVARSRVAAESAARERAAAEAARDRDRQSSDPVGLPGSGREPGEETLRALYHLLEKREGTRDWSQRELLREYDRQVAADKNLQAESLEGQMLIGAVSFLARRNTARLEQEVRDGLAGKGYDPDLINLVCQRLRERLKPAPTPQPEAPK